MISGKAKAVMQEFCERLAKSNQQNMHLQKKFQAQKSCFESFYKGAQLADIHPVGNCLSCSF